MLNGKIGLGILQLLLFAAGIFGAYWIFWNTSIHTIFPILISVMAYGWSIYSGYVSLNPDKSVNAKLIARKLKKKQIINLKKLKKLNSNQRQNLYFI